MESAEEAAQAEAAQAEEAQIGRPKKSDEERRRKVVRTRVRAAEKARIEEKAEAAGLSVSAYLRKAALGRHIRPAADQKTRHELRRIGANLNQLTRHAHTARRQGRDGLEAGGLAEALEASIAELRAKIKEL